MPQTWKGTYAGDRDYVTSLRRTAEQRQAFEQRHPEVAGDRRPVVAHEGRFEGAPLRRGDPVPAAIGDRAAHGAPPALARTRGTRVRIRIRARRAPGRRLESAE